MMHPEQVIFFYQSHTVRTIHELSLIAPQQPKNAMMKTMQPTTIKMTGADDSSSTEINLFNLVAQLTIIKLVFGTEECVIMMICC